MNCVNHPVRQGTNTCCKCGSWLCDECSIEIDGRIYCKSCQGIGSARVVHERRYPNILMLLLCSGLPGANYMFLGLIKRGLFVMTSFFFSIYLTGFFHFAGFITAGIVITGLFDSLRLRRRIIAGLPVSDDVDDIKEFFAANKLPILGLSVIIVVMELIQSATGILRSIGLYNRSLYVMAGHSRTSGLFAILAVVLGLYLLSKLRKDKRKHKPDVQREDTE